MLKGFAIINGICFFIAVLIILILAAKHSKEEKKELEEKLAQAEADTAKVKRQNEKYVQEINEDEELTQQMHSGDNIDSFNACIELMQKQSDKGKQRNKS